MNRLDDHDLSTLVQSLTRIADSLHTDADRLREFAGRVVAEAEKGETFTGSCLNENVTDLLVRTLNNSGYIAAVQTAISASQRAVTE